MVVSRKRERLIPKRQISRISADSRAVTFCLKTQNFPDWKRTLMYRLTISSSFASAHNLINYQGDCENLHGHNWKVEVSVTAADLDKSGLGIDFKVLKAETNALLKTLDHKYLNDLEPFKNVSPSSENIARYLYYELAA